MIQEKIVYPLNSNNIKKRPTLQFGSAFRTKWSIFLEPVTYMYVCMCWFVSARLCACMSVDMLRHARSDEGPPIYLESGANSRRGVVGSGWYRVWLV